MTTRVLDQPVFWKCLRRPRVYATPRVFARPLFSKCLRTPTCLRDDACLRPTSLLEVSPHAHVSTRRRVSSTNQSSGSVSARPRVYATTRVLDQPVFWKCLRTPSCLRDDACLRQTHLGEVCLRDDACLHQACVRKVSSDTHMASLGDGSCPEQCAPEVQLGTRVSSLWEAASPGMYLQKPLCLCLPCVC